MIINSALDKASEVLKTPDAQAGVSRDETGNVDFRNLFTIALDEADRQLTSVSYTSSEYKELLQEIRRGLRKIIKMTSS